MALRDADRAYELIKEQIVTTRMKPGTLVDEATLMRELGLGRTPIREGCKRLEADKLVVILPRRGMYVAEITLSDLRDLEEIRLELESLCARLAVRRITPTQLEEFESLVAARPDHWAETQGAGPHGPHLDVDRQLHSLVWAASHNTLLHGECQRYFEHSMRIWHLYIDQLADSDLHEEVFDDVLAALIAKDEVRAEAAVRAHILQFGASIRRHF